MLVASWVYHLPFGPGKKFINSTNPVVRQAVGGWRPESLQPACLDWFRHQHRCRGGIWQVHRYNRPATHATAYEIRILTGWIGTLASPERALESLLIHSCVGTNDQGMKTLQFPLTA